MLQVYLPIAEVSVNFVVMLGLGAAVGFLSGMFGVGGGFLLTPLLMFSASPRRSRWRPEPIKSSPPQSLARSPNGAGAISISAWPMY